VAQISFKPFKTTKQMFSKVHISTAGLPFAKAGLRGWVHS